MAWWDKQREGKRVFLWFFVVAGPILVALKLLGPRPFGLWDYVPMAVWSLLALTAAYRLIKERAPNA